MGPRRRCLVVRLRRHLTVTNTNDGGAGSFRQAILDANGTVEGDLINFAIPGTGPHTIVTFTPLTVTGSTLIDGYSQPGSVWNTDPVGDNAVLQVELLGQGTDGLVITGGATIVYGLALHGFQTAIAVSGAPGLWLIGNFIGTDAAGNETFPGNVTGVSITGTTGQDKIGDNYPAARNLIAGNSSAGVVISGCDGKLIRGNLIGTDKTGAAALPNGAGIQLTGSSNIQIGGPTPEERNVISGNFGTGVAITEGNANSVEGNRIGTDASGMTKLGNGGHGVRIDGVSENFLISSNVISGNAGNGVDLAFGTVNIGVVQNLVAVNVIGLDVLGTSPIGNAGTGIRIEAGDALAISYNAIAHNRSGIWRVSPSFNNSVTITENSIHSNNGLGIILGALETIAPNLTQSPFNFPHITSVVSGAGGSAIDGVYSGSPNDAVTIELFHSPACSVVRPTDFHEGETFFAVASGVTDGSGHMTFHVDSGIDVTGRLVTATATTTFIPLSPLGGFPTYQTSGFSQRLPFSVSPRSGPAGTPVVISGTDFGSGATVTIGGQPATDVSVFSTWEIDATPPALVGGPHSVTVTNTDGTTGTLEYGWIADFDDVPPAHQFYNDVVALAANGITGGIGGGLYGVSNSVLRQQMAVFLLKSKHGICYVPPPCAGVFSDVPCASQFAPWIEALAAEGITGGCGSRCRLLPAESRPPRPDGGLPPEGQARIRRTCLRPAPATSPMCRARRPSPTGSSSSRPSRSPAAAAAATTARATPTPAGRWRYSCQDVRAPVAPDRESVETAGSCRLGDRRPLSEPGRAIVRRPRCDRIRQNFRRAPWPSQAAAPR